MRGTRKRPSAASKEDQGADDEAMASLGENRQQPSIQPATQPSTQQQPVPTLQWRKRRSSVRVAIKEEDEEPAPSLLPSQTRSRPRQPLGELSTQQQHQEPGIAEQPSQPSQGGFGLWLHLSTSAAVGS
jgi:hypothetical protein